MTKTAALTLAPSRGLFDRIMKMIGELLDRQGEIAARNNDVPYFGL